MMGTDPYLWIEIGIADIYPFLDPDPDPVPEYGHSR